MSRLNFFRVSLIVAFFIVVAMLFLLTLSDAAQASASPHSNQVSGLAQPQLLSVESLLNPDGTLNLTTGASGAVDLRGWNVALDSKRGPVLSPRPERSVAESKDNPARGPVLEKTNAAPTVNDTWSALAHNGLSGSVYALAVFNNALYVGGSFTTTADASVTNLNSIAKLYFTPTQTGPTLTVNTNADTDDGLCDVLGNGNFNADCTLREAINAANTVPAIDTIHFAGDTTIALAATLPALTAAVTIDGESHRVILSGDSNGDSVGDVRVLKVNSGVIASLNKLTFTRGNPGADVGGAIYNNGNLTVTNSTFSNNKASEAGAIENEGILTIANSTFAGNTATVGGGGAVYNYFASLTITNSTISGNTAAPGSGIYNSNSSTLNLYNTILANSTSATDCYNDAGTVNGHHNLIETDGTSGNACGTSGVLNSDPNLGALGNNGGVTETFALQSGSPAIDAGDNTTCAAAPVSNLDQRGVTRPLDGDGNYSASCDIGSVEAATFTSCTAKPPQPTLKKPAKNATVTTAKVKFKWSAVACATSYQIVVKNAATGKTVFKKTVPVPKATTPNELPKGNYKWNVKARNAAGSTKSKSFTFTKS